MDTHVVLMVLMVLPATSARAASRHHSRPAPPYDHDVVTHDVVATDLTPQQQLELQFKASSSSDLIDDGLRTVRDGRLSTANRDQVLASLATGLDRLYTLALAPMRRRSRSPAWRTCTPGSSTSWASIPGGRAGAPISGCAA